MIRLPESLAAWNSAAFNATLKRELKASSGGLPLQQALTVSGVALDEDIEVMVIGADESDGRIEARVGIFFSGLVAGCSCADDPTPVEPQREFGEFRVLIDKATAVASVTPAPERDAD